jgi:hypothetical protein
MQNLPHPLLQVPAAGAAGNRQPVPIKQRIAYLPSLF